MSEFKPFMAPRNQSEEIKARRWLGYWFIGLFSRKYRLELEHYRFCGEFTGEKK
jgi:hypothetical protein